MPGTFSPHRLIKREYCQVTYHYASMPIFSGSKVSLVSLVMRKQQQVSDIYAVICITFHYFSSRFPLNFPLLSLAMPFLGLLHSPESILCSGRRGKYLLNNQSETCSKCHLAEAENSLESGYTYNLQAIGYRL